MVDPQAWARQSVLLARRIGTALAELMRFTFCSQAWLAALAFSGLVD